MMELTAFPNVPDDVERLILEFTAIADTGTALELITLARHVQKWIEPMIYHRVTLSTKRPTELFARSIESKGVPFFRAHVHALCLWTSVSEAAEPLLQKILSACSGAHTLAFWSGTSFYPDQFPAVKSSLHSYTNLRRLSVFDDPTFDLSIFTSLTHLDLFCPTSMPTVDFAVDLPNLLCLAIKFGYDEPREDLSSLSDYIIRHLPTSCQVVILFIWANWLENVLLIDPRLVLGTHELWLRKEDPANWHEFVVWRGVDDGSRDWGYNPNGTSGMWELAADVIRCREQTFCQAGESLSPAKKGILGIIE